MIIDRRKKGEYKFSIDILTHACYNTYININIG